MPQCNDSLAAIISSWFGPFDNDTSAMKFLQARGYKFTQGGMIVKPVPAHTVSFYERQCLNYLADEWDYGFNFRTDNMDASS